MTVCVTVSGHFMSSNSFYVLSPTNTAAAAEEEEPAEAATCFAYATAASTAVS